MLFRFACRAICGGLLALVSLQSSAQESLQISFSGYVQTLLQVASSGEYVKVGRVSPPYDVPVARMGVRRGRFMTTATYGDLSARMDINATEGTIAIQNIYAKYEPSWGRGLYVLGGLNTIPFAYELLSSSSKRVTFDRAHYIGDIFPSEADLGLTIGYKHSWGMERMWSVSGAVAVLGGNAGRKMVKNYPDLLSTLAVSYRTEATHITLGGSHYIGRLPCQEGYYGYTDGQLHRYSKDVLLHYYAGYVESGMEHPGGVISLVGEVVSGLQPGWINANHIIGDYRPADLAGNAIVQRPFLATMVQLSERLQFCPIEAFGKYVYYDRNLRYDPQVSQQVPMTSKTYSHEAVSHQIATGVNYYLQEDHLRLSLHYDCYLRQKMSADKGNIVESRAPLHMLTVGAQYSF